MPSRVLCRRKKAALALTVKRSLTLKRKDGLSASELAAPIRPVVSE